MFVFIKNIDMNEKDVHYNDFSLFRILNNLIWHQT